MIERRLTPILLDRLENFPAVALLGPRQVGKTTLSHSVAEKFNSIYLDMELPGDHEKLSNAESYLSSHEDKLVIIDEVQRVPELFQLLRGLIDQGKLRGRNSARFLLLGSTSIDLLQQSGETLAGRIAYLELTPLDLLEVDYRDINLLWERGGFPMSFLAKNTAQSIIWRENFIQTYLERDIPMLGPRVPAETLRRFWTMLAHTQGGLLNASQLARGLLVDSKTISRYLDLMVDLLLVRRLMPFHGNTGKRLVKSPKVYIRDSGLVHTLLKLDSLENLLGHPIVGMSWEGFVVESLIRMAPERSTSYFYRTAAGAEIDLLLELPGAQRWAIEIKRGQVAKPGKGFNHALEDLKPDKAFVVYQGKERYPIAENIEAINLLEMAALLAGF
ncbi:MAG TPA: ATPase [Bacteroidetes bacterium]|nr:ATPase [Bacteroidota bacterium]